MSQVEQIKALRQELGLSIAECRRALEESGGDETRARELLRAAGAKFAEKKSSRSLGAGTIGVYLHNNGLIAALVALRSETDFVAKTASFKQLAENLAMQVAAMAPASPDELLTQPFLPDESQTVSDIIKQHIHQLGERIEVMEFQRLAI